MTRLLALLLIAHSMEFTLASAQPAPETQPQAVPPGGAALHSSWQACTALDITTRLACFDGWAQQERERTAPAAFTANSEPKPLQAQVTGGLSAIKTEAIALAVAAPMPADQDTELPRSEGCRDRSFTVMSRFWELENGSSCDTFGIRGYRPLSLSLVYGDPINTAPSSPSADHTASIQPYQRQETRIQVSIRTKIAQGMLTPRSTDRNAPHDSLWFGYTQQSYWQIFNGPLSRPFRNTDHEPEILYVYPTTADLPAGWRVRYSGLGLVHQSNGQSLPLSRSWNRVYLMAGLEKDNRWRVTGRVWQRLPEKYNDDNPDIVSHVGRAEVAAAWDVNPRDTLSTTVRNTLVSNTLGNGSVRLEWLRTLGNPKTSGLRLHLQLFSGYGDSLVDYNRRRTVLGVGLSLVDF